MRACVCVWSVIRRDDEPSRSGECREKKKMKNAKCDEKPQKKNDGWKQLKKKSDVGGMQNGEADENAKCLGGRT